MSTSNRSLTVLIGGTLTMMLALGLRQSFGLYLIPITQTFGWSRETFSLAVALQMLLAGFGQPLAGAVADRYGSGRVVSLAAVGFGLSLLLMTLATTPLTFILTAGLLAGLSMGGMGTAVVLGAVGRTASESRRSMYFGIVTAGGSLGMFLLLPLGHFLISNLGWVAALTITGLLCLTIVPIGRLLREAPHPGDAVRPSPLRALRGAGQETRFWLLVAGFFVCGFHVSFIATHLPAYLSDQGIASSMAAWALSLIGLFNIFGSFTFGYLGSRFSKKYILCLLYLSRSIIISLFILLPVSNLSVLTFAAAMGFIWLGTIPLTSGLVGQMFGMRYLGALYGIVFLGHQLGSFLGVWLGGFVFDLTGSYSIVWWAAIGLGIASSLIHLPINELRKTDLDLLQAGSIARG